MTRGVRLAVKDLFDTAGLATTYGSAIFADHVPAETAVAVRRLEAAGYAVVGKTNLHEFAYGTTSENPHFGTVPNPLAAGRLAGGSSGGNAAALAAGLCDAALGSDTGGSVRIPAACCGVVGLKTTYGLVPIEGCFPLAPSYDTVGPMARDVRGCASMMDALVENFEPRRIESLEELAVGVAWLGQADPLVRARVERAAACFPRRRAVELPLETTPHLLSREVADVHRELFEEHADLYGEDVREKIGRGLGVSDAEAEADVRARAKAAERWLELLEGLDLVVTPTLPCVAPRVHSGPVTTRFTQPVNDLGWPALALPCGLADDGLPASVQLVGRPGEDALLLGAGEALERELASLD